MHSLRHTFASALIMEGAPVTEVQSLRGHASPEITLRIYSHWFKTADSGAVDHGGGGGYLTKEKALSVRDFFCRIVCAYP